MKKTICLSLALLMSVSAFPLQAQDTTNEKNQPASAQEDSAKEEESSIFSFFNFGSKDKKAEDGTTAKQAEEAPKETKIERLTKEADAGNLNSQMALGYIYLYGEDDTKPNPDKAFHYYKLAAEQNDNIAVNNLASLYYSGIGVEQNFAMAAELFRKAVQLGNTEAAVNLAFLYLAGSGVNKDSKEAINYFVIAANALLYVLLTACTDMPSFSAVCVLLFPCSTISLNIMRCLNDSFATILRKSILHIMFSSILISSSNKFRYSVSALSSLLQAETSFCQTRRYFLNRLCTFA